MLEITPEMLPKAFPVIPEIATAGSIRRRLDESSASVAERFDRLGSNLNAAMAQHAERFVAALNAGFNVSLDRMADKLRDALALPTIRPAA